MKNPFIKVLIMCLLAIACSMGYAFLSLQCGFTTHFIIGLVIAMICCVLFGWSACTAYEFARYCKYEELVRQTIIAKQSTKKEKEENPFKEFE